MSDSELSFTPEFILANFEGNYPHPVGNGVCAECNCHQIFQEHQFEPSDTIANYGEFIGGRIIQSVECVIGKINLENTISRMEIKGEVIEYEIAFGNRPSINGKRLRVDWEHGITSGLREGHRIDLDFISDGEIMTISFLSLGKSLVCGDCKKIQPEKQPPLSQKFWNEDKIFRANFNHWRKQLPIKINAWRISLKLSVIDIHFINLYLFENESEFKLKQDERKKLLSDCKLLV